MTLKQQLLYALTFLVSCQLIHGTAIADPVFFDDFADGSFRDDDPVSWVGGGGDNLSVDEDGFGMVMDSTDFARAGVQRLNLTDISVRTRLRVMEGSVVGIASRWKPEGPNGSNYYSFVTSGGETGIGIGNRNAIPDEWECNRCRTVGR